MLDAKTSKRILDLAKDQQRELDPDEADLEDEETPQDARVKARIWQPDGGDEDEEEDEEVEEVEEIEEVFVSIDLPTQLFSSTHFEAGN